jgi:cobalt-zinc-cadmium efflux system outer membrane protein
MISPSRTIIILILSLFILFIPNREKVFANDYEQYLEGLVDEVLERNPDLIKARERKNVSEHLVRPIGTLPDPQIGFSFSNFPTDTFDFDQEPMTSFDLFFTQKFPFPGKLSLKEEIADLRFQQAGKSVSELGNMLIYRTRRAYFRLYDIATAIDITKKTRAILKEFLGVAQQRYAVGKALQQDVFRAQTAVSNIDRRLFDLEKMRIEVTALINTLRSKQVDTQVTVTGKLPIDDVDYSEADLVESARQFNPTLGRLQLKIDEGEKGVSLAHRELYPDFSLSTRYRFREDRSDFLTGAVTLTVPLYATKKQREIISSRKFELKSSENGYESYLDRIDFNIREIKSDLFSLKNRISLLDSAILPEARNTVESAMSAYTVGKLEFISLVSAEIDLFKYELELSALTSKYNERVAELWMVIGKTLGKKEVSNE